MKIKVTRINPLPQHIETIVDFFDEEQTEENTWHSASIVLWLKREDVVKFSLQDFEHYAIQEAHKFLSHVANERIS